MLTQYLYEIHREVPLTQYEPPWDALRHAVSLHIGERSREAAEHLAKMPVSEQVDVEYAWHYTNARVHYMLDAYARVEDHLARAAELSLKLGEEATLMWKLLASSLRLNQMRGDESMDLALQAERHATNLGWEFHGALARVNIAANLSARGDAAGAVSNYMSCIDPMETEATHRQKFGVKFNLALALIKARQFRSAEEVFHELLHIPPNDRPTIMRAKMLQQLAVIAKEEKRYETSIVRYKEAMRCINEEEYRDQFVMLRIGIADLAVRIKDIELAREMIAPYQDGLPDDIWPARAMELASVRMRLAALEGRIDEAHTQFKICHDLIDQQHRTDELRLLLDDALDAFQEIHYRVPILEESVVVLNRTIGMINQSASKMVELRTQYERDLADREVRQQRERTKVIVDTQDQVQRQIGRDLHDSVGQDLTLLMRMANRLLRSSGELPPDIVQMLQDMSASAERAAGDVRRISHLLAAADVSSTTLSVALAELARLTQQAMESANVSYQAFGDVIAAPDGVSRAMYRSIQSLLQNVMRHSDADRVEIQLFAEENELRCTVEDNGRGFDPAMVTRGLGMREIMARMESVGGEVVFDSRPGHGTFVSLSVIFRQQDRT